MSAGLIPSEALLLGLQVVVFSVSPCGLFSVRVSPVSLLVRTPILLDSGTTLMLLFNANYSPFPNTATPAARASVYERGGWW